MIWLGMCKRSFARDIKDSFMYCEEAGAPKATARSSLKLAEASDVYSASIMSGLFEQKSNSNF